MLIVHFDSPAHFHLLHCIKGRQEYIVHPSPMASSLGRAMDIAVPVGWWAGWAIQRFLQPPRISSQGALEGLWLTGRPRPFLHSVYTASWRPPMRLHIYPGLETNMLEKHTQYAQQAAALEWWDVGQGNNGKEEGQTPSKKAIFPSWRINFISIVQSTGETERVEKEELPGHTWPPLLLAWGRKCPQTATVSLRMRWTL